jgi:DNA-binding response OmpR family regulator
MEVTTMAKVLIVDDEASIVLALRDELRMEGFEVEAATDGVEGLEKAREMKPDVMLLDWMMPGLSGMEVCRRLRSEMPQVWIIMLSVRASEVDRVLGLEVGADDYVTKPFSLREIVARVRVAMRRRAGASENSQYRFDGLEIDTRSRRVMKRGREVKLTRKEFDMLTLLARRAGEVITRDEFLDSIWGEEVYVTHRVIDTHLASLRKKIEDDPDHPRYIHSVRGIGYKLDRNLAKS